MVGTRVSAGPISPQAPRAKQPALTKAVPTTRRNSVRRFIGAVVTPLALTIDVPCLDVKPAGGGGRADPRLRTPSTRSRARMNRTSAGSKSHPLEGVRPDQRRGSDAPK